MVLLSIVLRTARNIGVKSVRKPRYKFVDSIQLKVTGGKGGAGFPKYGGIGGNGGNVYVKVKSGVKFTRVLSEFRNRIASAESGKDSSKHCIAGTRGQDKVILVPPGVSVFDEKNRHLGELDKEGSSILVARGGIGGRLETGYSSSKGESQDITLDLKLIADVGFVGFPNAGKSTLLAALSRAKPKIASYPFTTIKPNIGVMDFSDGRQISVADLPGLIEGAHRNFGMGHRFLRHVERTLVLMLVVDIEGFQLSPRHVARSCIENILLLNRELELYSEDLIYKPSILVVNKMDKKDSDKIYDEIKDKIFNLADFNKTVPEEMQSNTLLNFSSVLPISAKNANPKDVNSVKDTIREVIDSYYGPPNFEDELDLLDKCKKELVEQGRVVV